MPNRDAQETLLPPMAWNAWGDPAAAKPLSDGIRNLLQQALGVSAADTTAPGIDDVELAPPALAGPHRDALGLRV
ncbi:MAG TPA: FAD-binding oxidoreductase, partial [Mycobacterium sp.]|nr:FAD-binding oxidoreductase [Mycobacterium sp.]